MAKKKRLTAAELGIDQEDYDALLETRELLASGCLEHTTDSRDIRDTKPRTKEPKAQFNMNIDASYNHCGTVACIGGWMSLLKQGAAKDIAKGKVPKREMVDFASMEVSELGLIGELFFPKIRDWNVITPKIAVKAIDNFLTTGKPRWGELTGQYERDVYDETPWYRS
jgi:hypothetical protein